MSSLPPFITTSEKGSFPRQAFEERSPIVIDLILSNFHDAPIIRQELLAFKDEVMAQAIKPLNENASDREVWDEVLQPWQGKTWFEIPFFLAETYYYRRLLEIVKYFQPGPYYNNDPFLPMKEQEITAHFPKFETSYQTTNNTNNLENFQNHLYQALWANRGDLNIKFKNANIDNQHDEFIVDHSPEAYAFLKKGNQNIAFLLDNATMEIFYDLTLMDFLLETNLATSITCYAKNQPYFLSDAMPEDVFRTIDLLATSSSEKVQSLANRLKKALSDGGLTLKAPPFFSTSSMFRELPASLKIELASYDLCLMKGDANYRRLMGDRYWEPTTPLESVVNYFPTNFLSLRTPKSEVMVGLPESTYHNLIHNAEPDWQTNGKRGMITFWKKQAS